MKRPPRRLVAVAAAALLIAVIGIASAAAQEKRMPTGHDEIPPGLVPPAGLSEAAPLVGWAEAPPSPPRVGRDPAPAEPLTRALFLDPPRRYRPWTRWWWLGNLVEEARLRREIALFAEKGFGGVEIQAFSLGDRVDPRPGVRERILGYDSAGFWANVRAALDAAREAGLEVDLNHGSGWPAGGPWVGLGDHLETLIYGATVVEGGREVDLALPVPGVPLGYELTLLLEGAFGGEVISFPVEHRRLVAVVAAREPPGAAGEPGAPVATATRKAPIALDPATIRVLEDEIRGDRIVWQAPAGSWRMIAIYAMPAGEAPTLVAAPQPGLVLDHFDAAKVKAHYDYLFGSRTGLDAYWGDPLRGFFNDSLEFKVERHWAQGLLEEFERRRGYDLRPWLPILFVGGADNFFVSDVFGVHPEPDFRMAAEVPSSTSSATHDSDAADGAGADDERVRWDYELVVSDLVIERFLDASGEWAAARGLTSRAQGYGMALDAIRAAGHIDLPETEALYAGGSDLFLKLASSGAHLYGRPLVSAESFVWRGAEYRTTPQKARAAADKLFTAGVNHVVWHGTPYQVARAEGDGFGDEGWYPWSLPGVGFGFSTNMSEASPFWGDVEEVNRYLARAQVLLRQGRPEADLLVYYPFLRFPSSFGGDAAAAAREDLFNGWLPEAEPAVPPSSLGAFLGDRAEVREDPLVPWLREQQRLLQAIEGGGLTWEWTNAEGLERARWRAAPAAAEASSQPGDGGLGGYLEIGDGRYAAILFASAPWLPVATAEAVASLAEAGAPVFFAGDLPSRQPGLHDREQADARVRGAVSRIRAARTARTGDDGAEVGRRPAAAAAPRGAVADSDLAQLIAALRTGVAPSALVERRRSSPSIRHLGRALGDDRAGGAVVLVRNAAAEAAAAEIRLPRSPGPLLLLDGVSGAIREAAPDVEGWIEIELAPRDSIFLVAGVALEPTPEPDWPSKWRIGKEIAPGSPGGAGALGNRLAPANARDHVLDRWELAVEGPDVEGGRLELRGGPLFDWRDEPRLRLVSSPGRYRTTLDLPSPGPGERYVLDLGRVLHAADVRVNGTPVATLLFSPFVVEITPALHPGRNTIEVTVRSPSINRFIGLAERGDARYQRFAGREPVASGLLGPVVLRSVAASLVTNP